jgi:hypothetical protein
VRDVVGRRDLVALNDGTRERVPVGVPVAAADVDAVAVDAAVVDPLTVGVDVGVPVAAGVPVNELDALLLRLPVPDAEPLTDAVYDADDDTDAVSDADADRLPERLAVPVRDDVSVELEERVSVGVPVLERVADSVIVGDQEPVRVPDVLGVAVVEGVSLAVGDGVPPGVSDPVGGGVADALPLALDVGDAVGERVDVGVGVADASTAVAEMPRNCVPAGAVRMGAPPLTHDPLATSSAYTPDAVSDAVDAYTVAPSLETATPTISVTPPPYAVCAHAVPLNVKRSRPLRAPTHTSSCERTSMSCQSSDVPRNSAVGSDAVASIRGLRSMRCTADRPPKVPPPSMYVRPPKICGARQGGWRAGQREVQCQLNGVAGGGGATDRRLPRACVRPRPSLPHLHAVQVVARLQAHVARAARRQRGVEDLDACGPHAQRGGRGAGASRLGGGEREQYRQHGCRASSTAGRYQVPAHASRPRPRPGSP